jgi:prepilin-type N-terminal cleavage/methylation domain-containing protein/prepilin-type processing-associated H-X9-DG protein
MSFPRRSPYRLNSAFTLIELLVVIAIIAILTAIVLPVLQQAREDGRKAGCVSNLKQIGMSIFEYAQDYDETLPRSHFANEPYSTNDDDPTDPSKTVCDAPKWMDVLYSYLKTTEVFNCPSDTFSEMNGNLSDGTPYTLAGNKRYVLQSYGLATRERNCGERYGGRTNEGKRFGSYAINAVYWQYFYWTDKPEKDLYTPPDGELLVNLPKPADTILIFDVHGMGPSAEFTRLNLTDDPQPNYEVNTYQHPLLMNRLNRGGIIGRHLERPNVLWCDGHVSSPPINYLAEMRPNTNLMFRFTIQDD